jgi:hypothetical protein
MGDVMVAIAARKVDGAARVAVSLFVSVALGLGAHLLGSPAGHEGSLRDIVVLLADLGAIGLLAKRGELDFEHLARSRARCAAILFVALAISVAVVASERAPDALSDLAVSAAILAVTALVAAFVIVLFAERAVRAATLAIAAIVRWLQRGAATPASATAPARWPERALRVSDRCDVRSRRGPP